MEEEKSVDEVTDMVNEPEKVEEIEEVKEIENNEEQNEEQKEETEKVEESIQEESKEANKDKSKKKRGIIPIIIAGIVGIMIGALIVVIIWKSGIADPDVIATTKEGNFTETMFYDSIKDELSINYVINGIDKMLLNKKYQLTDEQKKEVEDQFNKVLNLYKSYGYTEELFLSQNGFDSKEQFQNYLELDYQRDLVYKDYLKTKISEDEIKKYYDENVYGEINSKHMLVQVTDTVSDAEAKKLAEEIIKKLDKGEEFDKVAKEYGDKIIFEELGYNGYNSGLAIEYAEASKALENGTYSKTPVKTSFGYHVIYKIDQKEKPSIEEATNGILDVLGAEFERKDQNIRYKALIKFREDNGVKFKDEKFKKDYEEYCKTYGV